MIIDKLITNIQKKQCSIVVGLDPRLDQIPGSIVRKYFDKYGETSLAVSKIFIEFNKGIIDSVADMVPAVKPQIAFYEMYGIDGLIAYRETCEYARKKGLIVVGDIKRGDIGSTSKAYSSAFIGNSKIGSSNYSGFYSDIVTVNPYLGDDCIEEFIKDVDTYNKGIFVLVKTSNKTSSQIQDKVCEGIPIYEHIAKMVNRWSSDRIGENGYSSVGAVVGATYPDMIKRLRALMPSSYFLIPGYGAQGAGANDIKDGFNKDGLGALINSSRGIIFAYNKEEYMGMSYKEAARCATLKMKEDINKVI